MHNKNENGFSPDWKLVVSIFALLVAIFALLYGSGQCQQVSHPSWIIPILNLVCPKQTPTSPTNQPIVQKTMENDEKITFLSELSPRIVEAAGGNYCIGRDPVGDPPTCTGAKIEVQGTPYSNSLFAHAASTVIFELNERYDTFVTSIFLFGSQCGDGATFKIVLDGKEVFNSQIIKHGEIPYDIRIDVKYGNTLRLETHTGNNNDYLCDGTVWGEPYLISKP